MADFMQMRWTMDGVSQGVPFVLPKTSLVTPIKQVANLSTFSLFDTITLPAFTRGTTRPTLLWDASRNSYSFQFIALQLVGQTGYANLAWILDKPVSSTDLSPTGGGGTYQGVQQKDLSCWTPEVFNTAYGLVHATAATARGLDGNGDPAILTNAGTTQARLYKLWAANSSSTTPIQMNVWVRD